MNLNTNNQSVIVDAPAFNQLNGATNSSPSGEGVVKQIEGLFVEMMLKSMRSASLGPCLIENEASTMFISLYDQQIAQKIANSGQLGFAELILSQLKDKPIATGNPSHYLNDEPTKNLVFDHNRIPQTMTTHPTTFTRRQHNPGQAVEEFISRMLLPAIEAGRKSGIPHQLIIAQAALESGWGKREILTTEGKPSYNLFAIKSTSKWGGKNTEITTTEYINGQPQTLTEKFKVYSSYTEAFNDYLDLIMNNPRYKNILDSPSAEVAAKKLQSAGYATDPNYADKLISIIDKIKSGASQVVKAYRKSSS